MGACCRAAHWKGDETFSSRYVPFSDVQSQKRTAETYSLDEVFIIHSRGMHASLYQVSAVPASILIATRAVLHPGCRPSRRSQGLG